MSIFTNLLSRASFSWAHVGKRVMATFDLDFFVYGIGLRTDVDFSFFTTWGVHLDLGPLHLSVKFYLRR